jgi:hypothetical protein
MLPVGSRSYSSKVDAIVFEGKSINQRSWGGKYGDLASSVCATALDTNWHPNA